MKKSLLAGEQQKWTSREVAEWAEKKHKNVLSDIRNEFNV